MTSTSNTTRTENTLSFEASETSKQHINVIYIYIYTHKPLIKHKHEREGLSYIIYMI